MRSDLQSRYAAACHRRQAAVAYAESRGDSALRPKHLRVGIDAAMSEQGGLARLLISKGVFTEEEYAEAMVEAAELEAQSWVDRVKRDYNLPEGLDFA